MDEIATVIETPPIPRQTGPVNATEHMGAAFEREKLGEVEREAQWRKRCKRVCGIARELQFKEMADSMRLGAIMAVMKPEELTDFNARIKANTKDIRQRLAATRAAPTTKVGED